MRDIQQDAFVYDIFGNEIYDGEEYWYGDEGAMKALDSTENYRSNNEIIDMLVEQLGTEFILQALGYVRRVCHAS